MRARREVIGDLVAGMVTLEGVIGVAVEPVMVAAPGSQDTQLRVCFEVADEGDRLMATVFSAHLQMPLWLTMEAERYAADLAALVNTARLYGEGIGRSEKLLVEGAQSIPEAMAMAKKRARGERS